TTKLLFFKFGYRRVTINDICRKACLSKMSFYRYFKNKEEMVSITLKNLIKESNSRFESIMEGDVRFLEKVKNLISMEDTFREQIGVDFINDILSSKNKLFSEIIKEQSIYEERQLKKYFSEAQEKGELDKKTPVPFLIFMLKDIKEKVQNKDLKKLYSNEKDMWRDLTNFYFFGIAPKNKR
ncbi:MAG: TetR/AcrR family transcriptional regulator, partial [Flavobacteriaceae bacterium]